MDGCTVCGIVSGSLSAYVTYEDKDIVCFLDVNPISAGHALVCPKAHISGFSDLSDELVSKIFCFGKRMASAFERAPAIDGVSILQNNGSFNELGHFHLHVFPRHRGDGFSWKRSDASLGASSGFADVQRTLVQALRDL
jgi:histidine triad (HIT) family protein